MDFQMPLLRHLTMFLPTCAPLMKIESGKRKMGRRNEMWKFLFKRWKRGKNHWK